MKEEKLIVEEQKMIINKIVSHLSTLGSDMYYEPTINICHAIQAMFKKDNFLDKREKELVHNLDHNDIQILLSYNSSCC